MKSDWGIVEDNGNTVTSLAEVWIEMELPKEAHWRVFVTSLAEVWIEIIKRPLRRKKGKVTSLAEVWIEIRNSTRDMTR